MPLNCSVGEDSRESPGLQGDPTSPSQRKSVLNIHWKDWCWSSNSNTLAAWCEELTHLKRPWCWERLKAGGKGDDRGWDGWMASPTQWTWVWVNSRIWWWTGKSGVLRSMGLQRVRHDWELNWTELNWTFCSFQQLHTFEKQPRLPVRESEWPLSAGECLQQIQLRNSWLWLCSTDPMASWHPGWEPLRHVFYTVLAST